MNLYTQSEEQCELATQAETPLAETVFLISCGFTDEEIASLIWLWQWYQSGGSDRATIVRHLEFLRFLVNTGELAL